MRKNILSINGNRSMNFLLQTVLSGRYSMVPVSNVFQGIRVLKTNEIDLIIIDFDYDQEESLDFVQHIRTSGLFNDKPVVALLSKDRKNELDTWNESGVDEFFFKPFSPMDMMKSIDSLVMSNPV